MPGTSHYWAAGSQAYRCCSGATRRAKATSTHYKLRHFAAGYDQPRHNFDAFPYSIIIPNELK